MTPSHHTTPPPAPPAPHPARADVLDRPLGPGKVRAVMRLLQHATRFDGRPALSEQATLTARGCVPHPATHVLVYDTTGDLVGYGQVDRTGTDRNLSGEFVVDPDHRRRGHGLFLGRTLLAQTDGRMRVWAHGGQPAALRLAGRLGLTLERELLQLRCPAATLTAAKPLLPPGFTVRTFRPGADEAAWLAVNAAAFARHPEQGTLTRADFDARKAEPWFDPKGLFLAVENGNRVAGYAWAKVHVAERLGEGYAAGVLPTERGSGLGAALYTLMFRHLAEHTDVDTLMGYVDADNLPSLRLCERLGLRRYASDLMFQTGPAPSTPS